MTHFFSLVIFSLLALAAQASDVIDLTDTNFDEKTKEGLWVIKFVAPWCGHCKKLAPTWEELATEFKAEGKTVNIASVDCTQFPSLGKRFEVSGYPTLVKLHQGTSEEYVSGNRAKTSLREWAVTIPVPKTIQQRAEETFKLIVRQFEIMINHALAAGVILILLGFLFGMLIALLFFTRTKLIYVDDPGLKASTANPAAAKKPAKKVD